MSEFYRNVLYREIPTKQRIEGPATFNKIEQSFSSKHFIGDGVPQDDNGFSISETTPHNPVNFMIGAGRIIVSGIEVILDDLNSYNGQPAMINPNIIPMVQPLAPASGLTENVWLDIWEYSSDPLSVIEIRWAVRVGEKGVDFSELPDHYYYHLADIVRTNAGITVNDQRRLGLTLSAIVDDVRGARGLMTNIDERLDVALNEDGTLKSLAGLIAVVDEVETARGSQPTLDSRLDTNLNEDGTLKSQTVGNDQVKTTANIAESKIQFSGSGHSHTGGTEGNTIGTDGLENGAVTSYKIQDEAVTLDKVNFVSINSGTENDIEPGKHRDVFVELGSALKGKMYFPTIQIIGIEGSGLAQITREIIYKTTTDQFDDDLTYDVILRISNQPGGNEEVTVQWEVFEIAKEA